MEAVVEGQGAVGEVVVDAHREVVERAGLARRQQGLQMIKYRLHHRRGELLRRQPVATAQHRRQRCWPMHSRPLLSQGCHHI